MTPEQFASFMDKGIITGLFLVVFFLFLYKGIPGLIKIVQDQFNKINAEHTHQIMLISNAFETTLNTITAKFTTQIEQQYKESEKYHKEHSEKIEELCTIINSTSLKLKKNAR